MWNSDLYGKYNTYIFNLITKAWVWIKKPAFCADLTCPIPCVIEVYCKCANFMLSLPGRRWAVFIVGVGVVIVDIFPCKNRRAGWTAHGCRHKCIDEVSTSLFHYPPCFIHHLHWTWRKTNNIMQKKTSFIRCRSFILSIKSKEPITTKSFKQGKIGDTCYLFLQKYTFIKSFDVLSSLKV